MPHSYIFVIPILFFGILVLLSRRPQARNIVLLVLVGIIIFPLDYFFIRDFSRQYESRNYPNVPGIVLQSTLKNRSINTHRYHSGGVNFRTFFGVDITYRYQIDGQDYEANRYRYDNYFYTREWAQKVIADHPVGSLIEVFYNPNNFADAVLFVGLDKDDTTMVAIVITLNIIFLALVYLILRSVKRCAVSCL